MSFWGSGKESDDAKAHRGQNRSETDPSSPTQKTRYTFNIPGWTQSPRPNRSAYEPPQVEDEPPGQSSAAIIEKKEHKPRSSERSKQRRQRGSYSVSSDDSFGVRSLPEDDNIVEDNENRNEIQERDHDDGEASGNDGLLAWRCCKCSSDWARDDKSCQNKECRHYPPGHKRCNRCSDIDTRTSQQPSKSHSSSQTSLWGPVSSTKAQLAQLVDNTPTSKVNAAQDSSTTPAARERSVSGATAPTNDILRGLFRKPARHEPYPGISPRLGATESHTKDSSDGDDSRDHLQHEASTGSSRPTSAYTNMRNPGMLASFGIANALSAMSQFSPSGDNSEPRSAPRDRLTKRLPENPETVASSNQLQPMTQEYTLDSNSMDTQKQIEMARKAYEEFAAPRETLRIKARHKGPRSESATVSIPSPNVEIEALKAENARLEAELQGLKFSMGNVEPTSEQTKTSIQRLQDRYSQLETTAQEKDNRIRSLEAQITTVNSASSEPNADEVRKQLETLKSEISDKSRRFTELSTKSKGQKSQIKELQSSVSSLQSALESSENEKRRLQSLAAQYTFQNDTTSEVGDKEQCAEKDRRIEILEQQLKSQAKAADTRLSDQAEEINSLKVALEVEEARIAMLTDELEAKAIETADVKEMLDVERRSRAHENSGRDFTISTGIAEMKDLEAALEKERQTAKISRKEIKRRDVEITSLKKSQQNQQERLQKQEDQISSLTKTVEEKEDRIANLDLEILSLRSEIASKTKDFEIYRTTSEASASRLGDLTGQLQGVSSDQAELQAIIIKKEKELEDLEKENLKLKSDLLGAVASLEREKTTSKAGLEPASHNPTMGEAILQSEIDTLRLNLEQEKAEFKLKLEAMESDLKAARDESQRLWNKISTLEKDAKSSVENIGKLTTELSKTGDDSKAQTLALERAARRLQDTIQELEEAHKSQGETLTVSEAKCNELNNQCIELTAAADESKIRISTLEGEKVVLELQLRQLQDLHSTQQKDLSKYQDRYKSIHSEKLQLSSGIEALRNQVALLESKEETFKMQIQTLQDTSADQQSKLNRFRERNKALTQESKEKIETLEATIEALGSSIATLNSNSASLEDDTKSQKETIAKFEAELEGLRASSRTASDAQKEIEDLTNDVKSWEFRHSTQAQVLSDCEKRCKDAEDTIHKQSNQLKEQIAASNDVTVKAQRNMRELEDKLRVLKEQRDKLEADLDVEKAATQELRLAEAKLTAKLDSQIQETDALRSHNTENQDLIRGLSNNISKNEEEINHLNQLVSQSGVDSTTRATEHTKALENLQTRLRDRKKEISNLKQAIDEKNKNIGELQTQLKEREEDILGLKSELEASKKELSKIQDRSSEAASTLGFAEAEVAQCLSKIQDLEAQMRSLSASNEQLQTNLDRRTRDVDTANSSSDSYKQRYESLEATLGQLKAEADTRISGFESQISSLEATIKNYERRLKKKKEDVKKLTDEIGSLKLHLISSSSGRDSITEELQAAVAELEQTRLAATEVEKLRSDIIALRLAKDQSAQSADDMISVLQRDLEAAQVDSERKLKSALSEIEAYRRAGNSDIVGLRSQISELQNARDLAAQEASLTLSEFQQKLDTAETESRRLEADLLSLSSEKDYEIQKIKREKATSSEERKALTKEVQRLMDANTTAKHQVESITAQLAALREEKKDLERRLDESQTIADSANDDRKRLADEISRLEMALQEGGDTKAQYQRTRNELKLATRAKQSLEEAMERAQAQIAEEIKINATAQEELARLRTEALAKSTFHGIPSESYKRQIKALEDQQDELVKANDSLQEKLSSVQREKVVEKKIFGCLIKDLKAEKQSLQERLQVLETEQEALKNDIRDRSDSALSSGDNLARLRLEYQEATDQISKLKIDLKDTCRKIAKDSRSFERKDGELQSLRIQYTELEDATSRASAEKVKTEKELEALEREVKRLKSEVHRLSSINAGLQADVQDKNERIEVLKRPLETSARVAALEYEVTKKAEKIMELTSIADSHAETVRTMQANAFRKLNKVKHNPLGDNAIQSSFSFEVFSKIRTWVRTYMPRGTKISAGDFDTPTIITLFDKIASMTEIKAIAEKNSQVILQALLCHYIADVIFTQPFFILAADGDTDRGVADTLQNLYHSFLKVDTSEGHTWRFQTCQLLNQIREKRINEGYFTAEKLITLQQNHCRSATENFMMSQAGSYIGANKSNSKCFNELQDIIMNASDLASKVWGQRAFMTVRGYETLSNIRFSRESADFEAHPINRLASSAVSRDGEKIAMVVQPEIVAYGNEAGEDYDKQKVWSKGVVALTVR